MCSDLKCQNIGMCATGYIVFHDSYSLLYELCFPAVFNRSGKEGVPQIIDFGESENVSDPNKVYNDFVGTIHYLPPESTRPRTGEDLKKSDLWCDPVPVNNS